MTTWSNRYGTLGPGPADRDRERLERELHVERELPFRPTTATPHRVTVTFLATRLRRLRTRLAHLAVLHRSGSPAPRPH